MVALQLTPAPGGSEVMNQGMTVWADAGVNQKEILTEKQCVRIYICIHTYIHTYNLKYTETS